MTMKPIKRSVPTYGIEPWPPGWPLPLAAMSASSRWEDVVDFYFAYLEATGETAPEPDSRGHLLLAPRQRAA
jgi:hypothetical protein